MTNNYGNFHTQAYFLHKRLLKQYLSSASASRLDEIPSEFGLSSEAIDIHYSYYERYISKIYNSRPRELSLWLLEDLSVGDSALVTTTQAFRFKKQKDDQRRSFSAKLAANPKVSINGSFTTSRCVSDTGQDLLRGHRRVSVLAHATVVEVGDEPVVELIPMFMGVLVERDAGDDDPVFLYEDRREVYPSQVDEFSKIEGISRPTKHALTTVSELPEKKIKEYFADILGQPFIENDWGGETSDLSSTITLRGAPKAAAFALKGPAVKGKYTMAKMGKNGDQGIRLFHESIDIAVVQYHGLIDPAVKALMTDLARSRGKRFMLIDGAQTAIILEAYGHIPAKKSTQPG